MNLLLQTPLVSLCLSAALSLSFCLLLTILITNHHQPFAASSLTPACARCLVGWLTGCSHSQRSIETLNAKVSAVSTSPAHTHTHTTLQRRLGSAGQRCECVCVFVSVCVCLPIVKLASVRACVRLCAAPFAQGYKFAPSYHQCLSAAQAALSNTVGRPRSQGRTTRVENPLPRLPAKVRGLSSPRGRAGGFWIFVCIVWQ